MTDNSKSKEPSATTRREALAGGIAASLAATHTFPGLASAATTAVTQTAATPGGSTLTFAELRHGLDQNHAVAPGHNVQIVIRWGDAITADAPVWWPDAQNVDAQRKQFGTDNDFIAFMPLPFGSTSSTRGLLCVNHEIARAELMFAGIKGHAVNDVTKEMVDVMMAANGFSVVEIALKDNQWAVQLDSPLNRRLNALDTVIDISGPAAGHDRLMTTDDPAGRTVIGTFANCAGGVTPWGTVVTAEENIDNYFGGDPTGSKEERNHLSFGISKDLTQGWYRFHPRFDVEKEPNEPNRFGWMVEIDPYDPARRSAKRTALGRMKHEGGGFATTRDNRVVVYMGDDEMFQCIYRFVSTGRIDSENRANNWGLLDEGTLYAARFDDNATLTWLPLVFGQGPLTPENDFHSQADVVIEARRAAKLLGATPMDRPEDIKVAKNNGSAYVALTKNSHRTAEQTDDANPRPKNLFGHILEMIPPGGDHAAGVFEWRPFIMAGDPTKPDVGAMYHADVTPDGALACPDNMAFDASGRVWISTDGAADYGFGDGIWAADVTGPGRALTRHFFRCPIGAEATGPAFTPDSTTFFVSVQHPGEGSNFDAPNTRWPDFQDGIPPRSSVVAIRRTDGKPVG